MNTRGVHLLLVGRRAGGWPDLRDLGILPSSRPEEVEVPGT